MSFSLMIFPYSLFLFLDLGSSFSISLILYSVFLFSFCISFFSSSLVVILSLIILVFNSHFEYKSKLLFSFTIILYSVLASFYRFRINGIDLLENRALINAFIWPITGLTAFIATLYYRDIMIANAERLGNYKSEIDREIELNKAWNKRMIDAGSQADKAVAPIRESRDSSGQIINQNKEAVNKQSTHQGEGVIDINTCSEAELANLPGVTLPMAKQAVEYRESVGRFTSVDHFIKQFNIKPHFAVRILDNIRKKDAASEAKRILTSAEEDAQRKIKAAELEAKEIECEPVRTDDYTGEKLTFFRDPDGLPLEIHE